MAPSIARQSSQMRNAVFRLNRRLRSQITDDELTDAQFTILAILSVEGTHTLTALAERERVSAPSLNRTVNSLQRKGYVMREVNAGDGRKVDIHATPAGRLVVDATVSTREKWLGDQLRTLSTDERETLSKAAALMAQIAGS